MSVRISHSETETMQMGRDFAKTIEPGAVVALFGDLGSGKTTFTKGLARGLGVLERVTSPTFVLMREYDLPKHNNALLHHLDLYRLGSSDDLKTLNLAELVTGENNIYIIEWAEKASQEELKNAIKIYFEVKGDTERKITIIRP